MTGEVVGKERSTVFSSASPIFLHSYLLDHRDRQWENLCPMPDLTDRAYKYRAVKDSKTDVLMLPGKAILY